MFFKKHMYRKIFVINRPSNKNICSEECKEFQGLHSVNSFGSLVHGLLFGRGSLSSFHFEYVKVDCSFNLDQKSPWKKALLLPKLKKTYDVQMRA